jgi:uncharacterized protein (UPF0333 family)
MKKFMLVLLALSFAAAGSAQSETKSPRKINSVTQNTAEQQTAEMIPADTQLIAVVTMKKDTLFFNKDEAICYTIKEVWDMNNYPDRPVILFVSNDQLKSVYSRVYGVKVEVEGPIKN